jgi:CspA family cold shock protein
VVYPQS